MNINWFSTAIPLWVNILIAVVSSVIGGISWPLIKLFLQRSREIANISGEWASYWETQMGDGSEKTWIHERIFIRKRFLKYQVSSSENSSGYRWHGTGSFVGRGIFQLSYWTSRKESSGFGVATFLVNSEGRYLVGDWFGTNGDGHPTVGRWIVAKIGQDPAMIAKKFFTDDTVKGLCRYMFEVGTLTADQVLERNSNSSIEPKSFR